MNPTLYDVLGVSPDASRDEIKKAWRDAADRFEPGEGGSSAQFRLFNEAAEVLLDPERRRAYDAGLAQEGEEAPAAPSGGPVPDSPLPGAGTAIASVESRAAAQRSAAASASTVTDDSSPASGEEPERASDQAADRAATETPAPSSPAATADEAEGSAAGPSTSSGGVPLLVLVVLGVLAAVAVGAAAYLAFEAQRERAYQESLGTGPAAAERAAVAVLSYDHESLEADRDAAAKFLTEDYREEYVETFELVLENAPKTKAVVEAEVVASAAMTQRGDRSADRVPVLLFVNQTTVSTANSGEPQQALNRVQLDMVRVDGSWLVDDITSY